MMYAMRKDRIMGDTRRRSRAEMSGANRRSSQRSGQPRRRPEQRNQMGDDRDKTQRQRSAQRNDHPAALLPMEGGLRTEDLHRKGVRESGQREDLHLGLQGKKQWQF